MWTDAQQRPAWHCRLPAREARSWGRRERPRARSAPEQVRASRFVEPYLARRQAAGREPARMQRRGRQAQAARLPRRACDGGATVAVGRGRPRTGNPGKCLGYDEGSRIFPIGAKKPRFGAKASQNPSSASGTIRMGFAPRDPSDKIWNPRFRAKSCPKNLKVSRPILGSRIGPDQGVELEPHGVEVEAEPAVR